MAGGGRTEEVKLVNRGSKGWLGEWWDILGWWGKRGWAGEGGSTAIRAGEEQGREGY